MTTAMRHDWADIINSINALKDEIDNTELFTNYVSDIATIFLKSDDVHETLDKVFSEASHECFQVDEGLRTGDYDYLALHIADLHKKLVQLHETLLNIAEVTPLGVSMSQSHWLEEKLDQVTELLSKI